MFECMMHSMNMHPRNMRSLGGRLSALRDAAGLSQKALAKRSGLTQSHISQIERGKREPQLWTLRALATALKVRVGDIVDGTARAA